MKTGRWLAFNSFALYLSVVFSLSFCLSSRNIFYLYVLWHHYAFIIIVSRFPVFRESSEIIPFSLSIIFPVLFIHGFTKLCTQMVCLNDEDIASNATKLRIVTGYPRNERPSYNALLLKIFRLFRVAEMISFFFFFPKDKM